MELDWFWSIRTHCQTAGGPFYLKQRLVDRRKVRLPVLEGLQSTQMHK